MRTRKLIGFFVLCLMLGACANPEDGLAQLWRQKHLTQGATSATDAGPLVRGQGDRAP